MSVQSTARQASQNATAGSGTLVRDVRDADAYFIEPQLNIFGALMGGAHMTSSGKEVTSPKFIKKIQATNPTVELFTNEHLKRIFDVTVAATQAGTTVSVSVADAAEVYDESLFCVQETDDVFAVTAVNATTGQLTIERITGSVAIDIGMHIQCLGQLSPEVSASVGFILRLEDRHYNYCKIFEKAWQRSTREEAVKRFTPSSTYNNDSKTKRREIMNDIESYCFGSKLDTSIGTQTVAVGNGLIAIAATAGTHFDFGGTVEKGEVREFGALCGSFASTNLVLASSIETISVVESVLDSHLNVSPSDIEKGSNLPHAKTMQFGPVKMTFLPCNFYSTGREGQGIVFDASLLEMHELTPLTVYAALDGTDHTLSTSKSGKWYYDGAAILPIDGGKHLVTFEGANNYSA